MAHPFSKRLPISEDAASLCCLRRRDSAVSGGGAYAGELARLEISVGGVEHRDRWELLDAVGDGIGGATSILVAYK